MNRSNSANAMDRLRPSRTRERPGVDGVRKCRALAAILASLWVMSCPATPVPSDSVLLPAETYTDQSGKNFHLADRRGHVELASMFYTSCTYTCPLTIDSARAVQHALAPAERERLRILFVSLDPQRDTPAVLAATATRRRLDPAQWTLARTDAGGVRKLAALLGIRYRQLANGDFNHSSELVLLDSDGRVLARTDQLGAVPEKAFLEAVRKALRRSPADG